MRIPRVQRSYSSQGFIPIPLVPGEVNWFYASLGIDDTYFANESVPVIADHIIALFGAKVLAYTKHDPRALVIDLERIDDSGKGATFIHTSKPGTTSTEGPGSVCEARWASFPSPPPQLDDVRCTSHASRIFTAAITIID